MDASGVGRFDKFKNLQRKIEVKREPKAESRAVVLSQEEISICFVKRGGETGKKGG